MTVKPNIRWQLLLAVVCLGLVLSLLSFQVQTAALCSTRVPAAGGSLVEGIVGAPQYLNPLLGDGNLVDEEINVLLFDGLMRYDESGSLVPALAKDWTVSDDARTVTFTLKDNLQWHDGEPVTAEDVVFSYGLLQDPNFPVSESLRGLWQTVVMTQTGRLTVAFSLPEPYSPFLDATTRGIVPKHILGEVAPQRIAEDGFNQNPVGTGPFMVLPGENWQRSGRLHLVPVPSQWPEAVSLDNIEFRFFPDTETVLAAYESGDVQAINNVPPAAMGEVGRLSGLRLYTTLRPRYTQLLFNLTENGAAAVRERDVRHALAYALDRDALIDSALEGQGVPLNGPYVEGSWAYSPGATTVYAHNVISATQLLDEAGWATTAEDGVRAKGEDALRLRLLLVDSPTMRALAAGIAQQWGAVGVATELVMASPADFRTELRERVFDVALTEIAADGDPDLYDFWSQEAIVRGDNFAGWNSRRASEALEQARQIWSEAERRPYYEAFLRTFSSALPAISLYQHVYTYGLSDEVKNADIGRISTPRDRYKSIADWFMLYRDVTVSCP